MTPTKHLSRVRKRPTIPPPPRPDPSVLALGDLWRACTHTEAVRVPQAVVERAAHALGAHSASMMLRDTDGDTLRMAASVGLPQELAESVTLLVGERIAGRVAATGVGLKLSGDPRRHPALADAHRDIAPRSEVASALCVPVADAAGNVLGVLSVSRYLPAPAFTEGDLAAAALFAAYAGARLSESKLRREATARVEEFAALERLAASVAHEMRNPLSSIKGAAQYVRGKLTGDDTAVCAEFLTLVIDESDSLARLASDLIEWARPQSPVHESRDLVALIRGQVSLLCADFEKMGVAVRLCGDDVAPAWANVDAPQVARAVRNLLLNASDAAASGDRKAAVMISIWPDNRAGRAGYTIAVDDTGAGVAPERRDAIWEPFVTDKARGVGLGLAQVRATAVAHAGFAECTDAPAGGARFTLFLPHDAPSTDDIPREVAA